MKLQSLNNKYFLFIRFVFFLIGVILVVTDNRNGAIKIFLFALFVYLSLISVSFLYFCIFKSPETISFNKNNIELGLAFGKRILLGLNDIDSIIVGDWITFISGYKVKVVCSKKKFFWLINPKEIEDYDLFLSKIKEWNPKCRIDDSL